MTHEEIEAARSRIAGTIEAYLEMTANKALTESCDKDFRALDALCEAAKAAQPEEE